MFSLKLRQPKNGRDISPSASSRLLPRRRRPHAIADFTEADEEEEEEEEEHVDNGGDDDDDDDDDGNGPVQQRSNHRARNAHDDDDDDDNDDADENNGRKGLPVLPLFSATHLDALPIYSVTHAIRIIITTRTETTLTWEQLRSPQISQFLVKPMQQQIRTQHFSRATLYALMANCLQFTKEGQRYAANAGISNTRAKVCELLALKLLKEYTIRELIDALAYDFYPLQGLPGAQAPLHPQARNQKQAQTASRTSTLEVAIRASAKHFLAHPVVVQQLEAIWNGAIIFYSAADRLHRQAPSSVNPNARTPLLGSSLAKQAQHHVPPGRRTVMLYDPRQASMLKLSRLRVPRYRSFLSTLSLAVLIGLFLAVLVQRSVQITGLELVFWFWSAGFMLDELVGFNEQGFALYIMSFWNIFDLGILVLLIAYYCMRAYGVFLVDPHHWNAMAYDVLAANAILLLPRIFSVLDHYQYFSQLLIALRLMAVDLAAVFVLVLIMCSGFYVFFTHSQSANNGGDVAYKIFQILMGFTPAAWDVWPQYNWLARVLMMMFLIICHFLIVTILITVLTNSFMTIASNANEEHQFLFAINTISMVKNDALFSYVAPSNIFAWLLMPLRYCLPLKHFVWLNRTIIKITHLPVLFCIYLYERFWLAPSMYEPTDLVENHGRSRHRTISFRDPVERTAMFSPNVRVREESVAGFHKDRALEEVFRRAPDASTLRTQRRNERRKTQTAIRNWMDQNDDAGAPLSNWPTLDSRAVPEWHRRLNVNWDRASHPRHVSDVRSTASDPADFMSMSNLLSRGQGSRLNVMAVDGNHQTDADGDDELVTNDEDEDDVGTNADRSHQHQRLGVEEEDYFTRQPPAQQGLGKRGGHSRSVSTNTILYKPEVAPRPGSSSSSKSPPRPIPIRKPGPSGRNTGANTPAVAAGRRSSPRRPPAVGSSQPRPMVGARGLTETGGVSRTAMLSLDPHDRLRETRRLSSVDLSVLSDNFGVDDPTAGMAGSFQTQMAMAMMKDNRLRVAGGMDVADRDRMGRLVLARMKTLEESFADVIKEMRDLKNSSTAPQSRRNSSGEGAGIDTSGQEQRAKKTNNSRGDATPRRAPGNNNNINRQRPVSRRSMKETTKGKMKELRYSTTDDEAGRGGGARSSM
ncbi:hypothetical protein L249_4099 [Ophiocordyceps polyrhachis-furcata BCC 54312]|uniref:Uncharacterized protein n=1 Tax=Ophiocordyceps polyrhachis-furcata BCC 54312 TaxID=1330021 RepID=A0A367L5K6_9HYPO|nr:hypothetical protein L249_4099 [Ophiocordyceps polyrhachis-furcata BCC 54312]